MPPAALAAATIGAGALSAGGQIMQGISERNAAQAQAQQFQRQAGLEREAAGAQIASEDYEANRLMALARANAGAAGVAPSTGSAKVVNMMNASEAMLRDTATRYSGELRATSDLAEAAIARQEGQRAFAGGLMGAAGTALTTGLRIKSPTSAGGLGL